MVEFYKKRLTIVKVGDSMKQNKLFLGLFILFIISTLILTYHFFMKTLALDIAINSDENIEESDYHFVLIVQELESEYLQELYAGAKEAARKNGATIEYWGTKQTNISDHINLIEMAIASKVDGILTQGLSNEFEPVIRKAIEKEIPLVMVDSNIGNNELVPYVGTDNYQAGYKMGLQVIQETEGDIKIGILTGSLIANNLNERVEGFIDAISLQDRLKVVSIESSNLSKIQGADKTFQMLRKNPDISIFLGTSALDSLGITEGISKAKPAKPIRVYAFDVLEETVALMKNGDVHAILEQRPYEMGSVGVEIIVDQIMGEKVNKDVYTPTTILKKEDIENEY